MLYFSKAEMEQRLVRLVCNE